MKAGSRKSSWAAHMKYAPVDSSNTRLKFQIAPRFSSDLNNRTLESRRAYCPQMAGGRIGGAVVRNHDFEIRIVLREQAVEGAGQSRLAVEHRHPDAD